MTFCRFKCAKVICKKGWLVKSKNIPVNTNTDIKEVERKKTYTYSGIDKTNGIDHSIDKEKIRKEIYRKIEPYWKRIE